MACLNARDLAGIAALLHPDCRLIDSYGEWIDGPNAVIAATERLFALDSAFKIRIDTLVELEGEIFLRGRTFAERAEFQANAFWRARIEDGLIRSWQSFGPVPSGHLARILGDAAEE